jgi:uncharacterized protein
MAGSHVDGTFPDALLDAACYAHPAPVIEKLETHISWVVLTGSYAYKLKKPIKLPFLDFSTLEARRRCCEEELRLNRRLAAGIYLDVVEIRGSPASPRIGGSGALVDYAVRMRQFPQDALASRMLERGTLTPELVAGLARKIAWFHMTLPPAAPGERYGTTSAVLGSALENFDEIATLAGPGERGVLEALRSWTEREFMDRYTELAARRVAGWVRECHGDLHLGNIALIDGSLVPFDCIEFNAELRWNDVMSEVAFLVMDLVDRGAQRLAWLFLNEYLEATGAYAGMKVLRFYLVYRAMVRAKVHLIRAEQCADGGEQARLRDAFRAYTALAERFTRAPAPAIVLMHGLSGCGKSTVAMELAARLPAVRVRSDVERKRLAGIEPLQRSDSAVASGLYRSGATERTYQHLAHTAATLVAAGYPVILDAAFLMRRQRMALKSVAHTLHVPIAVVSVYAPEPILKSRIEARASHSTDASEATLEVLEHQKKTGQPVAADEGIAVVPVDGSRPVEPRTLDALLKIVGQRACTTDYRRDVWSATPLHADSPENDPTGGFG